MEIKYVFTKKRREIGAPCHFADVGPHLILDIAPNPDLYNEYVQLPTADKGTLCRGEMSVHEANTITNPTESRGIDHEEGGWPADVDHRDDDQVARFKKKIEKDEVYIATIKDLGDLVEKLVLQNNAIDIYEEYFGKKRIDPKDEDTDMIVVAVYRDYCRTGADDCGPHRSVSDVCWSADAKKLAVAYIPEQSQTPPKSSEEETSHTSSSCLDCCIWISGNPVEPSCILKPDVPVSCISFSPRDLDILITGYDNGQIALWDISKCGSPLNVTLVDSGHTQRINDLRWINSKCGTEFISVSSDGYAMSWDTRNLLKPTESWDSESIPPLEEPIESTESTEFAKRTESIVPTGYKKRVALTCLEYDPTVPYRFMVGTITGRMISCSRRVSKDTTESKIIAVFEADKGPILSIERNPYLPKLFFAVTAFMVQLWSEDHPKSALINLVSQSNYVTHAAWCPTRPSVLFQAKTDGTIEVWDILLKRHEPLIIQKLDDVALTKVRFADVDTDKNPIVICGLANGTLHLLELPYQFRISSKSEKIFLASMVDRETKREKLLEPKPWEIRFKEKVEVDRQADLAKLKELEIPDDWVMEDLGEEAYAEMEALEFGSGFLDRDDLEQDETRRAEALDVEPEAGEVEFLEKLGIEVETEAALKKALVKIVTEVESDISNFPAKTLSIEDEFGEEEFLGDLKTYGDTVATVDTIVDRVTSAEDTSTREEEAITGEEEAITGEENS